jgi:hypothetical protein
MFAKTLLADCLMNFCGIFFMFSSKTAFFGRPLRASPSIWKIGKKMKEIKFSVEGLKFGLNERAHR